MRTYLHDPVTPHKKADPLIMSKRLRLAAVSLKKKRSIWQRETLWVLMHSGSQEVVVVQWYNEQTGGWMT